MTDIITQFASAVADRYAIERPIGEGGMATVYLAKDLRHDRRVALKVLKPELAAVLGAERFLREIKTTANLQHPNILPLFDSGTAEVPDDGTTFLYYVMPYVDGETLREKLNRERQLGVEEAVQIACTVADALEHAHGQGIIHRDIKPENILLDDGRPLVTDFGIALAVRAAAGDRMTETGLSLGTPDYMSPEQATAERELSQRSDVYSLGAVLYEMLTGDPPHTGSSAQQIIMKIVAEDAEPINAVRKSVPDHVVAAVAKSLEKLPADRFASTALFAEALTDPRVMAGAVGSTADAARPTAVARRRLAWPAVVVVAALAGVLGWFLRPPPPVGRPPVIRFSIPVAQGITMGRYYNPNLAVSPDGRAVAYFADETFYVRALDQESAERRGRFPELCCPWFSPDGRWIVFGASSQGMDVDGGPLVDVSAHLRDVDLVHASTGLSGIRRKRPRGDWERITSVDSGGTEGAHLWPQLLPGGTHVLYTIVGPSYTWRGAKVVVEDIATHDRTIVAEEATFGRYLRTGHIMYVDEHGTLHAIGFDLDDLRVRGSPFVVTAGVRTAYWAGAASVAVADSSGTLAFVRGSSWENHILTWVDRRGRVVERVGRPVTVEGVRLSPDERYALTHVASNNSDVSVFDLETGEERRMTFDPETEDNPVWSPDGAQIAYHKTESGREHRIYTLDVDGTEPPRHVYTTEGYSAPRSWSPDGTALVLWNLDALLILDLANRTVDTVTTTTATEGGRFSPDGRWLAYVSDETGEDEVYVVAYPGLRRKQQVSVSGGRMPEWAAESEELFYVDADTVMVTSVETGATFSSSPPRALFVSEDFDAGVLWYAVSADGQRILYPAPNPEAPAREIHVVVNWFEELRERARNER